MPRQPVVRVLHILGPLRPSGMERMLVSAADSFRAEGVASSIYGVDRGSVYADELRNAGYSVALGDAVGTSIRAAFTLRRLVREQGIDVIHVHTEREWLRTAATVRWALARRGGGVVRTVHSNFLASGWWLRSRRLQARLGDRFVDMIVAPSPDVADNERALGRECQVIFNWVDSRFYNIRESRESRERGSRVMQAVIVGNCSDIKRHELALEAIWQAGFCVSHVGDESGATSGEKELLDKFERAGRLVRRGVEPPDEALREGDVYCMPSRFEGFGVAFAEALVAGQVCLVSDSPGLRWARDIPGVTFLPDEVATWASALTHMSLEAAPVLPVGIDLSATRGAREYAAVYRAALSR